MSKVIPFVSKSDRELARLIREARAIYNSVFPTVEVVGGEDRVSHTTARADIYRSDGVLLP
jgi:hypothetical protein